MAKIPSLQEMLQAGVHFGHRTSRWHPKMQEYIFGARNGVHVIDIEKTQQQLEEALSYVERTVSGGGEILFIGTKKQLTGIVEKSAKEADAPYINVRWLGGTFTNFSEIQKLIKNYLDLKDKREKGELKKYTKLEQLQFDRKIDELDEKIGGISTLQKLPEAVFVVDVRHDKTAVMEARKRGITVIGIVDTNVNPDLVDYVIPANDDSVKSVMMITRLVADAVKDGRGKAKMEKAARAKAKAEEDDLKVTEDSKASVDDLDDAMKEQLAREREESRK